MTDYFSDEFVKEAADVNINVKGADKKKEQPSKAQPAQAAQPPVEQQQAAPAAPAGQPMAAAPAPAGQDPAAMGQDPSMTSGQIDPMTGQPFNAPQPQAPISDTNNMRQSGLPTTAIVCTSDCRYAQNEKGMCGLNKIDFSQVKMGVMECLNYEPAGSEPTVMPPQGA